MTSISAGSSAVQDSLDGAAMTGRDIVETQTQSTLAASGGPLHDQWSKQLVHQIAQAQPLFGSRNDAKAVEAGAAALAAHLSIGPAGPVEAMLAAQIIAASAAALECYERAWLPDQSFEVRSKYLGLADRAGRSVAMLSDALARQRGRGHQQITVRHINVQATNAVVAETIIKEAAGRGREVDG